MCFAHWQPVSRAASRHAALALLATPAQSCADVNQVAGCAQAAVCSHAAEHLLHPCARHRAVQALDALPATQPPLHQAPGRSRRKEQVEAPRIQVSVRKLFKVQHRELSFKTNKSSTYLDGLHDMVQRLGLRLEVLVTHVSSSLAIHAVRGLLQRAGEPLVQGEGLRGALQAPRTCRSFALVQLT